MTTCTDGNGSRHCLCWERGGGCCFCDDERLVPVRSPCKDPESTDRTVTPALAVGWVLVAFAIGFFIGSCPYG